MTSMAKRYLGSANTTECASTVYNAKPMTGAETGQRLRNMIMPSRPSPMPLIWKSQIRSLTANPSMRRIASEFRQTAAAAKPVQRGISDADLAELRGPVRLQQRVGQFIGSQRNQARWIPADNLANPLEIKLRRMMILAFVLAAFGNSGFLAGQ